MAVIAHPPVDTARHLRQALMPSGHRGGDDLAAISFGLPVCPGGFKEGQKARVQKSADGVHVNRAGVRYARKAAILQPVQHIFDARRSLIGGDKLAARQLGLRKVQPVVFAEEGLHVGIFSFGLAGWVRAGCRLK